jgi:hypothetical protein
MPRKIRNNKRRDALTAEAQAWVRGDKSCGFYQFKHDDELEAVWLEYGDTETMFWRRDMSLPITLEDLEENEDALEENEDAWLGSGEDDKYGGYSFFVYRYYTDDEKQALWNERGDKKRFRWQPDMRRPELA